MKELWKLGPPLKPMPLVLVLLGRIGLRTTGYLIEYRARIPSRVKPKVLE